METKIHALTLAKLNHSVGTARRDAAFSTLCKIALRDEWPAGRQERVAIYRNCLALANEVLYITERSSLMYCNPKQMLWDKPVLHFLRMLQQLLQTLNSLAEHVDNVQQEADTLAEHLGEETCRLLESTCHDFEEHEFSTRKAMHGTLVVGKNMLQSNTAKRRDFFTEDDSRRYDKAFAEYMELYSGYHADSIKIN